MSTTDALADDEVIELEPTLALELADGAFAAAAAAGPGVAVAAVQEGSLASLAGETDVLKRQRLFAAAVFLAIATGLVCSWTFASDDPGTMTADGSRFSTRMILIGLRCVLATVVAGILASDVVFSRRQLRVIELVLFLGFTLLVMASQYFVGVDLLTRGSAYVPVILAFIKDGVIQTISLMMMYGMIIPNRPWAAAKVILATFLGVVLSWVLVRMHPGAALVAAELGAIEESGSNVLFLALGASLSVYGCYLVNGLRTELHQAKKFGQYRLVRKLGAGGMGEVYLAEHALLKRPCALKLIRPDATADPVAVARFEREVQSSARLAHHNTIEIYDYGHTEDGTFYYVMQYLQGASLAELVKAYGPLPPGRVIYLFRQVCAGLAEAHGLGLVHRDLKPANLFVAVIGGESDVAKVLDFGLVKVSQDSGATALTADMTVSGTPLYMAPEQAVADKNLDARADVYALGAMMYYALTGKPPFDGDSAFQVMMAHARDPVVPPSQVLPGIPQDLEQVVLRCLAKKPQERYQGVKALGEALEACASAGEWGPNRADAWWTSFGSAALEEPAAT